VAYTHKIKKLFTLCCRWVVLAAGWYLAAGRKVAPEKLARHSSLGHLAAWGLPAAQTVAVLVLRDVDADELTGNFHVRIQNNDKILLSLFLSLSLSLTHNFFLSLTL
jgi:hypothetical protein